MFWDSIAFGYYWYIWIVLVAKGFAWVPKPQDTWHCQKVGPILRTSGKSVHPSGAMFPCLKERWLIIKEIKSFVSTRDRPRNSCPVRNSVMMKFKLLLPLCVRLHRNMLHMQIFNFFMEKRENTLALKYFREKHNILTFLNQTVLFCFIEPKWKFALQLNPGRIQVL